MVTASHTDALALIHQAAFPPEETWSSNVIALHIGLPGGFGFIDARGGMILARTIMDESETLTLAVMPVARRRGLGLTLLHCAMGYARSHDARSMFLEVAEANLAAHSLYTKCGFSEVGRRKRYYANGDDALVMRATLKALAAGPAC